MEKFTVDGVVIKTSVTGEADRIVWVLTRDRGVIRAFAKGARGTKNRLHGGTSLFCYCDFTFSEKNNVYNISEALVKEVFFDLRKSVEILTLSQYFCEVMIKCLHDKCDEEIYLRLLLNCFHFLTKGEKAPLLIKSVFEMRFACAAGYMPALVACDVCSEYETDIMYFNCADGRLFCKHCARGMAIPEAGVAVISAMRHICFSDFSKIFSFDLQDNSLRVLNRLTESYLRVSLGQDFALLRYFNDIKE